MNGGMSYYPVTDDPKFVEKITKKKEFYIHRKREIKDKNFQSLRGEYLKDPAPTLFPNQKFVRAFFNPETPYKNGLLLYDTGTGKTLTAIAVAEGFKDHILQLRRKDNKNAWVYIVAESGAQDRFFQELIGPGTFGEYTKPEEVEEYRTLNKIPENERTQVIITRIRELKKEFRSRIHSKKKDGIYKFVSFREFQNHTIGRRDKREGRTQIDTEGNIIRKNPMDEIKNLNNCLLIIDEVHRLEGNDWMASVRNILQKSHNTRVLILTATPMYHESREIIQILNLIADKSHQLDKNDVFIKNDVSETGISRIKDSAHGRIFYLRGKDPENFPEVLSQGEHMPEKIKLLETFDPTFRMKYTKLVRVPMSQFHYDTYKTYFTGKIPLDMRMLMDIALPDPSKYKGNSNDKIGRYDKKLLLDIKSASEQWKQTHKIRTYRDDDKILRIGGEILQYKNLKKYSSKYVKVLDILFESNGKVMIYEELIDGLGINLFTEILIENGYTPIRTSNLRGVTSTSRLNQRCYICGRQFNRPNVGSCKNHKCSAAYFAVLIGVGSKRQEREQVIMKFNDIKNINGSDIKIILGSSVVKESIDFKELRHSIILNYQNNFSSIKQIEGRGARNKSHVRLPVEDRNVKTYKIVSSIPNDVEESAEELQYRKQEYEHIKIQKIARALKEIAVDCHLNRANNIDAQEIKKYRKCETHENKTLCSPDCDYMDCYYDCIYEPTKPLDQKTIDIDTWNKHNAYRRNEIIRYIKTLFKLDIVWDLESIIHAIKVSDKFEFIEEIAVEDVLYDMIHRHTRIFNSLGTEGYILHVDNYFLFQPLGMSDIISVEERRLKKKPVEKFFISIKDYNVQQIKHGSEGARHMVDIYKELGLVSKPSVISKTLSEQTLDMQVKILEVAIEETGMIGVSETDTNANIINIDSLRHEVNVKILSNYAEYLITEQQLNGYPSRNSRSLKSESSKTSESKHIPQRVIGHFFGDAIRCYDVRKSGWVRCKYSIKNNTKQKLIENDFIIGYIDKTNHGKIVFKLKFQRNPQSDRRKENKGFICKQTNNKQVLMDIANELGIDDKLVSKNISAICDLIEIRLRDIQYDEYVKNPTNYKRYFYEYLESRDM